MGSRSKKHPNKANAKMSLLDLNRAAISQMPSKKAQDCWSDCHEMLDNFAQKTANEYFMLYGKEIGYFTLFKCKGKETFYYDNLSRAVLDCLNNVGEVYSIDPAEDSNGIEIWVKTYDNETTVLYLFPYDAGIVRVKE